MLLDMPSSGLEQVIYYNAFVITKVDEEKKKVLEEQSSLAYKAKLKNTNDTEEKQEITKDFKQVSQELKLIKVKQILNEKEYYYLTKRYNDVFEANTGSDPILEFLKNIDLQETLEVLEETNKKTSNVILARNLKRIKIIKGFLKSGVKPE